MIVVIVIDDNDNNHTLFFFFLSFICYFMSVILHFFFAFKEKMSSSTATSSNVSITGPLTIHVVDAQTSAENGRKFTKYKVTVNYNGQEWDIWRRYKEFHTLNEKVNKNLIVFF